MHKGLTLQVCQHQLGHETHAHLGATNHMRAVLGGPKRLVFSGAKNIDVHKGVADKAQLLLLLL
jgi:hypothetical protein